MSVLLLATIESRIAFSEVNHHKAAWYAFYAVNPSEGMSDELVRRMFNQAFKRGIVFG